MIESLWILLRMGNIFGKICRQNQNTHFMFNKFSSKDRAVDEIIWEKNQKAFLLFHCSNWYANAPYCYIIRTLTISFLMSLQCGVVVVVRLVGVVSVRSIERCVVEQQLVSDPCQRWKLTFVAKLQTRHHVIEIVSLRGRQKVT